MGWQRALDMCFCEKEKTGTISALVESKGLRERLEEEARPISDVTLQLE